MTDTTLNVLLAVEPLYKPQVLNFMLQKGPCTEI